MEILCLSTVPSWQRLPCRYDPLMGTMNVSLPDALREFVDEQVTSGRYGTSSEYIRELIRREQDRARLRSALLKGARSPVAGVADAAFFDALRRRARRE